LILRWSRKGEKGGESDEPPDSLAPYRPLPLDEDFRQRMYRDPIGTAESTGLPLDDEDREAISKWDMNPENDQVLKERIAKFASTN
jgi:hypothetical protein